MNQTLVTIGCSITKDHYQKTWADFLATSLDCELLNIGARGAGIDFLSKRAMVELVNHDPAQTLIAIMLPSSDRFDLYIDHNHPLQKDFLEIASWQDGIKPALVRLDGSLSQTQGYSLNGAQPRGFKKHYYKFYYNDTFSLLNHWFHFINLQNFLKLKKFKYFFTSVYDLNDTTEKSFNNKITEFSEQIDLEKFLDIGLFAGYQNKKGFMSFVNDHGYNTVKDHPVETAHEIFVKKIILPFIEQSKCYE